MNKKFWRSYADAEGESHLEQIEADLALSDFAPPAPKVFVSQPAPASAYVYLRAPAGWNGGWHPSPRRQLFVVLAGTLEGEVSDGQVLRLDAGDVVLLEDTSGRGHTTRVISSEDAEALVIALPG